MNCSGELVLAESPNDRRRELAETRNYGYFKVFIPLHWLPFSSAIAQSSGGTGSLQGSVTDAQGLPLFAAQVRYQSVPPSIAAGLRATPGSGETNVNGAVSTDVNGKFTTTGLPAAIFLLCASVPKVPYLDSCTWGQAARVTVSAGAGSEPEPGAAKGCLSKREGERSGWSSAASG